MRTSIEPVPVSFSRARKAERLAGDGGTEQHRTLAPATAEARKKESEESDLDTETRRLRRFAYAFTGFRIPLKSPAHRAR